MVRRTGTLHRSEEWKKGICKHRVKSRKGMQVRLGTQNTKEKPITELMKKSIQRVQMSSFLHRLGFTDSNTLED